MRSIDPTLLYEIRGVLDAAPHGAKDIALHPYAARLDVSIATLRRHLRRQHGRAKECTGRPSTIPAELVEAAWDEIVAGQEMGLQARQLPMRIILDRLRAAGMPGADRASVSGINNAIRAAGLRRESRRQRMEPAFALDVVHFDFSRSKYVQLHTFSPNDGDYVCRVYGRHLGYKEDGKMMRTWLASAIDGHSRMARMRMFAATGEDAGLALLALNDFWSPEQAAGHPAFHPARELWVDRGSAGRTQAFTQTLASVGVDVHVTQSKEAQGKVERQFRTLWAAFELPLALELGEGATLTLGEYNSRLHAFLLEQAQWDHPTMPGTRAEAYASSIRLVRPDGSPVERILDADLLGAFYDTQARVVDATGHVTIERTMYLVPERIGRVWVERGDAVRIYRYADGTVYGSLVAHPGERPVLLVAGTPAAAHPVGRADTPAERRDPVNRRTPQPVRLAAIASPPAEAPVETSRPTPTRIDLRREQAAQAGNVLAFRRPAEQLTADGPREESDAPDTLTGHALRAYVGRRLDAYGLGYGDVAHLFDGLAADPATTQRDADLVLSALFTATRVA